MAASTRIGTKVTVWRFVVHIRFYTIHLQQLLFNEKKNDKKMEINNGLP